MGGVSANEFLSMIEKISEDLVINHTKLTNELIKEKMALIALVGKLKATTKSHSLGDLSLQISRSMEESKEEIRRLLHIKPSDDIVSTEIQSLRKDIDTLVLMQHQLATFLQDDSFEKRF